MSNMNLKEFLAKGYKLHMGDEVCRNGPDSIIIRSCSLDSWNEVDPINIEYIVTKSKELDAPTETPEEKESFDRMQEFTHHCIDTDTTPAQLESLAVEVNGKKTTHKDSV